MAQEEGKKSAVQSFFKPSLATIIIFGIFSILSLFAYLANEGPYVPLLYPLTYLFSIIQPLIHPIEINQPIYTGSDDYAIFYTWILPPASIAFFHVLSCTLVWLWNRDKTGNKLLSVGAGAALLIGLFLILPLGVSAVARATGPPPPEYISYVFRTTWNPVRDYLLS